MKYLLYTVAVIALLLGAQVLVSAKSAIHEIEAFLLFIMATIALSGGAIITTLKEPKQP